MNLYYYFKDAVPKNICDEVIKLGLSKEKNVGKTSEEAVNGKLTNDTRKTDIYWIEDEWVRGIMTYHTNFANHLSWNYDLHPNSELLQFGVYTKEDHYTWHVDDVIHNPEPRKLTTILMLSDKENYEGGDLLFNDGVDKDENIVGVKCDEIESKGSIVVFPSVILHKVSPILSGQRMTLVSWTHGPNWR